MIAELAFFGALATLVGWPLIQIVAIWIRRPYLMEYRQLIEELKRENDWSKQELDIIEDRTRIASDARLLWILPFAVLLFSPFLVAGIAKVYFKNNRYKKTYPKFNDMFDNYYDERTMTPRLREDLRFRRIEDLVFPLTMLHAPISALFSITLAILYALPIVVLAQLSLWAAVRLVLETSSDAETRSGAAINDRLARER